MKSIGLQFKKRDEQDEPLEWVHWETFHFPLWRRMAHPVIALYPTIQTGVRGGGSAAQ